MAGRFQGLAGRLRRWRREVEFALAKKFGLATREDRAFLALIGAVGVLAGFLGVAVHRLVDALQVLLWGSSNVVTQVMEGRVDHRQAVLALAVGGALVGLVVLVARGPASGPGMSILIEAVALRGGRVPVRPVVVSSLAAIATVGSGGSLGREGPMIRLGAMISSRLATHFRLSPHRVKILVGCGAAAGLAAAYNIPIGGAVFAMEVILGNFALQIFGPIVAASVLSTLIARAFEGDTHRFAAPGYELVSGWEILSYVGLGVVAAVAAIGFVFGVRGLGRQLRRLPLPEPLRPVIGFSLLGLGAFYVPAVLEGGREPANLLLLGELAPELADDPRRLALALLGIAAAKIVATGLTAGSGGVGGLFTPSLFFGALVGGAYGTVVHSVWPGSTGGFGAYAVVGMAAMAAGTSHAPISSILILFEFTGNYDLILPLMVASITASVLSRKLHPYSIYYTRALQRKGVDLNLRMEEAVLAAMRVADLCRDDPEILRPADGYSVVVDRFFATHRSRLFVVSSEGRLVGEVSLHDIKHVLSSPGDLTAVVAHDLATPAEQVIAWEGRLHQAAEIFAHSDHERLAVVDEDGRFRGIVTKRDLLAVYAQEVLGRPALLATFVSSHGEEASRDFVELPPDFAVRLVELPASLAGRTLAEARLPSTLGLRVLELKRPVAGAAEPERIIPVAETVLELGDQLIVLGPSSGIEALEAGGEAATPGTSEAEAMRQID